MSAGTRRAYGSYWNRILAQWGGRRLDEPTPSEIRQLMIHVKTHVVHRRNARSGRSAQEHLVAALRCLYQRAVDDGLIKESDNPTPQKLTSLHDEVLRLGRLVDDLSTLAAAQSAVLTLDRAPADLAKIAAHAASELQPLFEDAGVHLDTDTSPVGVNADRPGTQIVTNLLTNAVKFTPPGGHVTLATRRPALTPS